jgi:hypothetical protein
MSRNKGGLSLSNKRYINKNFDKKPATEIAAFLGKPVELILNYIKIELGSSPAPDSSNKSPTQQRDQRVNLRNRPEWFDISEQYTPRELNIFEEKYHRYMKQFQYDVEPTEERQIFDMIGLEIDIDRNKKSRKRNMDLREARLREISKEEKKDDKDGRQITLWQNDVLALESATSNSMKELKDLMDRKDKLNEYLMGNRDQRLKESTSSKTSWVDIIKYLNSPESRTWESKRLAAMNLAVEKEKERLSSYNEYADGKIDRPFLNSETYKD